MSSTSAFILDTRVLIEGALRIVLFKDRPYWQARIYSKKKRNFITRSLKTADITEATTKAIKLWQELEPLLKADVPLNGATVAGAIEDYLKDQEQRVNAGLIKPGSLRDMKAHLKVLLIYCNLENLSNVVDIKSHSLNRFESWRRDESLKITTGKAGVMQLSSLNKSIREVRAFWKWLLHHKRVTHTLELTEVTTKQENVKRINLTISPKDMQVIEQELDRRTFKQRPTANTQPSHLYFRRMFYHYVSVLGATGMRPHELLYLIRWENIKHIQKTGISTGCSINLINPLGKGSRTIVSDAGLLFKSFRKYATEWRHDRGYKPIKAADLIFGYPITNEGYPYSQISLTWRQLLKSLKFQDKGYTLRSLRSTYITNKIAEGVSPYILARNTGHSVLVMKKHYEQLDEQQLIDALLSSDD